MKKRVLPFLWAALCTFLYYSCKKDIAKDSDQSVVESGEQSVSALRGAKQDGTSIFDPTSLVAPHAQLKTLGEGFSFTEGPAVDKHGNVFFYGSA